MKISDNYDLKSLNTFGISVMAKFFVEIKNENELQELFSYSLFKENNKLFLGGGSNVLLTKNFNGLVISNKLKGIEILSEDSDSVVIRCMGGEIWHDLVIFAVERGLWGIENLALIPGTVGAAPMQNIGAYGVELKDTLLNVEAYEINTGKKRIFDNKECAFGYRDSIFKNSLKDKYFISAITLKLNTKAKPDTHYKVLQEYLEKNKIEVKNPKDISMAVSAIRRSKLPDPKVIGNAGSFFKNVFVEEDKLHELINKYPEMPYFKEDGQIKIPTAWLIEQCGPKNGASWKGYRVGRVGVHEKQALVLVNYGGATGQDINNLAKGIIRSVFDKFQIILTSEVNLI
jgi:UDP-N-acetylmuramate dehydrogenase